MPLTAFSPCFLLVALSAASGQPADEAYWARWRGPQHNGHASGEGLPTTWNADSIIWKTDLPGQGQASPITWGDRIFLTSALEDGRQRVVFAVDRNDGRILWQKIVWQGEPEPTHVMNGWASASCTTDGERVYAFFGRGGGLFCLSVDGEVLWSHHLGDFEGPWGTAACPVLAGDFVVQNCDADRDARIVAFDKKTGEPAWETKRPDHRGWSTPILVNVAGREELVVNGHDGPRAYDPANGRELWHVKSFNGRGSPTVTPWEDLLLVINGLRGDVYAVRPGGDGSV
ncbi:MAG: PQQ-like beta-propeller repeat protein, partial [Planctomycetes bacterium]|nr:PQQ-like beta-propeller repeat protein [Planctomycetota bacterium]